MANKLIFLSVKVTNPFTDERFTKDFRIAEALGQYIIQKSKHLSDPIYVFLNGAFVEETIRTPQNTYTEIVIDRLAKSSAFLFLCSDVRYLNGSNHLQSEINAYYTSLSNKLKPKNSFFRLTSKLFDEKLNEVDNKMKAIFQITPNIKAFDSTKDIDLIVQDLQPTFEKIFKSIK